MKNVNIEKLLIDLTYARRSEVINALTEAGLSVNPSITNKDLYQLVMAELNKGNEQLFLPLGKVMDATFDLTPLIAEDGEDIQFSSAIGWDWIKTNADTIGSIGGGLLGGLFGGGGSSSGTQPPTTTTGGGADTTTLLLMQQQQAAAQAARDDQRRREEAASRSTTMWVVGGIVGFLVIGGIITAVIVSGNRAKAAK